MGIGIRSALGLLLLAVAIQAQESKAAREVIEAELRALAPQSARRIDVSKTEEFARIRAIDGHLAALHDILEAIFDDEGVRLAAVDVLAAIGDPSSVHPVLLLLRDDNERPSVRIRAIDAAVRLGDARAVMPLVEVVGLPEEKARAGERDFERWADVKMRAAEAIPRVEVPGAAGERLIRYLTEEVGTPSTVASAARCLGLLRAARAVPELKSLVRVPGLAGGARREAIVALGRIGDAEGLPEIEAGLADPDESVRMEAVNALGFMGRPAARTVPALLAILRDDAADLYVRASVPGAVVQIEPEGAEAVAALVERLGRRAPTEDEDPLLLHVASMVALQFAAPARAVPLLAARGDDPDPLVRETVQGLLVRLTRTAFEGRSDPVPEGRSGWESWWETAGEAFFQR